MKLTASLLFLALTLTSAAPLTVPTQSETQLLANDITLPTTIPPHSEIGLLTLDGTTPNPYFHVVSTPILEPLSEVVSNSSDVDTALSEITTSEVEKSLEKRNKNISVRICMDKNFGGFCLKASCDHWVSL